MRLSWRLIELQLREAFVTHKGAKPSRLRQWCVELQWQQYRGLGLAVPAADYGFSEASIDAALARFAPLLAGRTPYQLDLIVAELEAVAEGQMSAVAAVDMALHDLLGQSAQLPLHQLLGLEGRRLPDTFTSIGMMAPEAAAAKARELSGWSCLKLKMGAEPDFDRVCAVRAEFSGLLCVDGNGAWSATQAVGVLRQLADCGVDLVEQPIAAGAPDALHELSAKSPLPIVADEDCIGPDDILRLRGCVHGVNIKLLKCGGLRAALKMIWLARQAGLKVMLGCKVESSIGVTAMAQLGGLADWLDLDGHLNLSNDPYRGIAVEQGRVSLPDAPGLGLRTVESFAVNAAT